jgi:LmbE family N-acetylglucosaminyl deacetylase
MFRLKLGDHSTGPLQILCLGAHPDDIEIGCGGTILRLAVEQPGSVFHWVVFCAGGPRGEEARKAANQFTGAGVLRAPILKTFRDGFMPFDGAEVKEAFEQIKQTIAPDLIFTHHRNDGHQDHRLIAELTSQTFRAHLILEYEIPKSDGDLGTPGVFVTLSTEQCREKVGHIMNAFPSQHEKHWFREETFLSLMRLRGIECAAPSGYAEAFHCRKVVL